MNSVSITADQSLASWRVSADRCRHHGAQPDPKNYFADVEQSAFAPAHVVDGISYSRTKCCRDACSLSDAHRYPLGSRLRTNPCQQCPYMVANYERDGQMRMDENGGSDPITSQ